MLPGSAAYLTIGRRLISAGDIAVFIRAIRWALNASAAAIQNMRIDHRRADVAVAEQLLNRPNIISILQQMGRKRMAKRVRTSPALLSRRCERPLHSFL